MFVKVGIFSFVKVVGIFSFVKVVGMFSFVKVVGIFSFVKVGRSCRLEKRGWVTTLLA